MWKLPLTRKQPSELVEVADERDESRTLRVRVAKVFLRELFRHNETLR